MTNNPDGIIVLDFWPPELHFCCVSYPVCSNLLWQPWRLTHSCNLDEKIQAQGGELFFFKTSNTFCIGV